MWEARFLDGPLSDEVIYFAVGEPFETMHFAPAAGGWARVGDETLTLDEPWPGMVTYQRASVRMGESASLAADYSRATRFTCPKCGLTSAHPTDVEQGYCGNCHEWTGVRG